jgi:chromosome segregation ATPase
MRRDDSFREGTTTEQTVTGDISYLYFIYATKHHDVFLLIINIFCLTYFYRLGQAAAEMKEAGMRGKQMDSELTSLRGKPDQTLADLDEARTKKKLMEVELISLRGQLDKAAADLQDVRMEKDLMEAELVSLRKQLHQTVADLQKARTETEMKEAELVSLRNDLSSSAAATASQLQELRQELGTKR